jgi:hypothetical protein
LGGTFTAYVKVVEEVAKACTSSALSKQERGALPIASAAAQKGTRPTEYRANDGAMRRSRIARLMVE